MIEITDNYERDNPAAGPYKITAVATKTIKLECPDGIEDIIEKLLREIKRESGLRGHQIATDFTIYIPWHWLEGMRRQMYLKHHFDPSTTVKEYEGIKIAHGYEPKIVIAHYQALVYQRPWMHKEYVIQ